MSNWDRAKKRLHTANPQLKKEYDRLGPRFEAIEALVAAREKQGVTQSDVALRMGVRPHVISRLESALHSPRIDTLAAYAEALGLELHVRLSSPTAGSRSKSGRGKAA